MILQRGLASGDDGVDTRTVSVVRTNTAVAVAVERHCIAARSTFAFAGDEVHERLLEHVSGFCIHDWPNSLLARATLDPGNVFTFSGGGTASGAGIPSITARASLLKG